MVFSNTVSIKCTKYLWFKRWTNNTDISAVLGTDKPVLNLYQNI